MPDIHKKPYDPRDKVNQWPKAYYHPTEPMRTVNEEQASELEKADSRWRNAPYHNPDGSPIKESRPSKPNKDLKNSDNL